MPEPSAMLPGYLLNARLDRVQFQVHTVPEEQVSYGIASRTLAVVDDDRTRARAELEAEIQWSDQDGKSLIPGPFELSVAVVGDFLWREPEADPEDIAGWVEFNAEHLLWPYLRAYVSTLTALSGLPPLTIFTISQANPRLGQSEQR